MQKQMKSQFETWKHAFNMADLSMLKSKLFGLWKEMLCKVSYIFTQVYMDSFHC